MSDSAKKPGRPRRKNPPKSKSEIPPWNKNQKAGSNPNRKGKPKRGEPQNKYGESKKGSNLQLTSTMWKSLNELKKSEKLPSRSEATEDLLRAIPELVEEAEKFLMIWMDSFF
jgi:hypothetical protein